MNSLMIDIILYSSIIVLVVCAAVLYVNRAAARDATAALAEGQPLKPVLPRFTAEMDFVIEDVNGKRYRVYFSVERVEMMADE